MEAWLGVPISLVSASILIRMLVPFAFKIGLLDKPSERKLHSGSVPLIGGISIFFASIFVFLLIFQGSLPLICFVMASAFMVLIGVLDDKHDLSVRLRIVAQLAVASLIVFGSSVYIESLGDVFGLGKIELGVWGIPFTLLAIMAAINAYNMVDGIDGLLGTLAVISFAGISVLAGMNGQHFVMSAAAIVVAALFPFLIYNMGFSSKQHRKIFMGDAGSMFIGLTVVWMLTLLTEPQHFDFGASAIRPIAAVWLVAVPMMDMLAIMFRRIQKGQSPFKPDRNHLHHVFMNAGCNDRKALFIISIYAFALVALGLVLEWLVVPEPIVLAIFLFCFAVYAYTLRDVGYVVRFWDKFLFSRRD